MDVRDARALTRRRLLAASSAAAVVLAAAVIFATGRTDPRASAEPSASRPSLLAARFKVLDRIPGGGVWLTQAYDAFRLIAADGSYTDHPLASLAVGTPAFNGHDVAYWSRAAGASPCPAAAVPHRIEIWDAVARTSRVLLDLPNVLPGGNLLWTADRGTLLAPARDASGDRFQLWRIDAATGASVQVLESSVRDAIGPVYADDRVIVGVRGDASPFSLVPRSSYVVIDARTGAIRSESLKGHEATESIVSPDGFVAELVRNFESASGPLRVWSAADPATTIATVDGRGIESPRFWPGTSEIVYVGDSGVVALDLRSGASRVVIPASAGIGRLIAFDRSGGLLLAAGDAFVVYERAGNSLRARTDIKFDPPSSDPSDPLGFAP